MVTTCRDSRGTRGPLGIDGKPVRSSADLFLALEEKKAGESVALEVVRDGRRSTARVVLEDSGEIPGAERGPVQ